METAASRPGLRAFVAIHPPKSASQKPRVEPPIKTDVYETWRVLRFEIPEEIMNQQFGQKDLIDFQSVSLNNMKEVEDLLRSWGLDSAAFDAPWNCEYPL